jgi:hypothetical protein
MLDIKQKPYLYTVNKKDPHNVIPLVSYNNITDSSFIFGYGNDNTILVTTTDLSSIDIAQYFICNMNNKYILMFVPVSQTLANVAMRVSKNLGINTPNVAYNCSIRSKIDDTFIRFIDGVGDIKNQYNFTVEHDG